MILDKQIQISLHIRRQIPINGTLVDYHDVLHLPEQPIDIDVFLGAVKNGTVKNLFTLSKKQLEDLIQTRVDSWKNSIESPLLEVV